MLRFANAEIGVFCSVPGEAGRLQQRPVCPRIWSLHQQHHDGSKGQDIASSQVAVRWSGESVSSLTFTHSQFQNTIFKANHPYNIES